MTPGGLAPKRPPDVLLIPAVAAAALALSPLVYLIIRGFSNGVAGVVEIVADTRTYELIARSLGLAFAVTVACLVVGVSFAWLVAHAALPGRRVVGVLAALPLAMPSYVAAYAWVSAVPQIDPFLGSVLVLTLVSYPFVYLPVLAAFERSDPALEEVARASGRGPWSTFFSVTLPQVRPAAAAGGLLVSLYVLSDFGAVSMLRFDAFTRVIYTSYTASFDRTRAAVLSMVLVLITICIVVVEHRTRGRASYARIGAGTPRAKRRVGLRGLARWVAPAWVLAILTLAIGFPMLSIGYWLVRGSSAGVDSGRLATSAGWTIVVAAVAAVVTIALAVPVGVIAARYPGRLGRRLEHATFAGHALPGIVVALAFVFLSVRLAYPLYQTVPLLVMAYAVLFLPAAIGSVRASVGQSPVVLEELARSLGRRPRQVLREITLPLAGPGVLAGALLVFLSAMKELPATLLLRPTGMDTLATQLWTQTSVGAYAAAAPYAATLVVLAALPAVVLGWRRTTKDPDGRLSSSVTMEAPGVVSSPGMHGVLGNPGDPGGRRRDEVHV